MSFEQSQASQTPLNPTEIIPVVVEDPMDKTLTDIPRVLDNETPPGDAYSQWAWDLPQNMPKANSQKAPSPTLPLPDPSGFALRYEQPAPKYDAPRPRRVSRAAKALFAFTGVALLATAAVKMNGDAPRDNGSVSQETPTPSPTELPTSTPSTPETPSATQSTTSKTSSPKPTTATTPSTLPSSSKSQVAIIAPSQKPTASPTPTHVQTTPSSLPSTHPSSTTPNCTWPTTSSGDRQVGLQPGCYDGNGALSAQAAGLDPSQYPNVDGFAESVGGYVSIVRAVGNKVIVSIGTPGQPGSAEGVLTTSAVGLG